MKHLLAANSMSDIFGTVNPPVGGPSFSNPAQAVSNILGNGLRIVIIVAGFMAFFYLMWGAFDWLTSEGDSEKIGKARSKMTQAVIGLILVIAAFAFFSLIAGDILGIIKKDSSGNWIFSIPTFGDPGGTNMNQNNQNQNNQFPNQRAAP